LKFFGSRALWAVSVPLLFAEVSEIVLHVTDTLFLSRVGVTELGAVGLADSALEIALVLALGLVDGIQILTARQIGRRRPRRAMRIFNLGLLLIVGVSTALALLLRLNAVALVDWIVESEAVGIALLEFLDVAWIGVPFTVACFAYSALLVNFGRTRVLVPATLLLLVTNAALDYVLIFGKLGFAPMGIRGAALGSVLAEVVVFAFLTAYLWRTPSIRRYGIFRVGGTPWRLFGRLARISAPVSVQGLVEALRWFAFFLIIERVGLAALAIANVVYVCYSVLRIPAEAFGEVTCSAVARTIGRGRLDRVEPIVHQTIRAASLVTLPLIAAALIAPEWILSAFDLGPDLLAPGAASLRVVALAMAVVVPAEMWFTAVLGTGDTRAALGIEITLTIVMLASCWVLAMPLAAGPALTWCSLALGWLVTLGVSYGWLKSGAWKTYAY
jgi:MATE family multidrug resistance protein